MIKDKSFAEMNNKYNSVTLIPNLADLDTETTLIDMTGYCNNKSYLGVVAMSFFLRAVFERAREVKFIIVLN
jgi:hypothetical protein